MTVTIQAFVDGVCIGTRELTINVKGVEQTPGTGNAGDAGNTGNANLPELKDLTIDDLASMGINTSGYISSGYLIEMSSAEASASSAVALFINDIETALVASYPQFNFASIRSTCEKYFDALIEELDLTIGEENTDPFDYIYTAPDGLTYNKEAEVTYYVAASEESDEMEKIKEYKVRLYEYDQGWWNRDKKEIQIDRSYIVEKFLEFLKASL